LSSMHCDRKEWGPFKAILERVAAIKDSVTGNGSDIALIRECEARELEGRSGNGGNPSHPAASYFEFLIHAHARPRCERGWPQDAYDCILATCRVIQQAVNFSHERVCSILRQRLQRPPRTIFLHWRGEVSRASVLLRVRCGQVPQRPARDFVESARECNVTTLSGFPRCLPSRLFRRRACCNKPPLGALHHRPRAFPLPPTNAGAEAPCNCHMTLLETPLPSCTSSVRLVFDAPFKCNAQCRRRLLA
jgi:hypothetical protein